MEQNTASPADIWSEWLLHRRTAGDADYARIVATQVRRYVDRVLDAARLAPGMTLLDAGTGEGVVAWRAIERIGPELNVILADISPPLLDHAQGEAQMRGLLAQCRFVQCAADDLAGIADASVDVVTTRAVLAYIADKPAALRAFHRVLKPGGRISLAEPMFRDEALETIAMRMVMEARGPDHKEPLLPLLWRWKAAQFPDTEARMAEDPLTNYTERDLFRFTQNAGFTEVDMMLHVHSEAAPAVPWEVFAGRAPHPLAASLAECLAERFDAQERALFEQIMRPAVEAGGQQHTQRMVYISAIKPAA